MAHVLVIEDDTAVRTALEAALQAIGHIVDTAVNGIEGLEKCAAQLSTGKAYDLVITDLVMPKKDGVETILELKIEFPRLKIIAISGGDNVDIMETTYRLGADGALAKPFSLDELSNCVTRVLAGEPPA